MERPKLITRRLESADFHKGFIELLAQLSTVGAMSQTQFDAQLAVVNANSDRHSVMVIEDANKGRIIACATLYIEPKFLRSCGKIGHIEDVVVSSGYRGLHLGLEIIETLKKLAKERGCYKVILNCSDKNVSFYSKLGFSRKENQMAVYF